MKCKYCKEKSVAQVSYLNLELCKKHCEMFEIAELDFQFKKTEEENKKLLKFFEDKMIIGLIITLIIYYSKELKWNTI